MPRMPRLNAVGVPQHIIQRGNNRQICFVSEQDYGAYANWLGEYSSKFDVDIHAWVFMTNHVHLLATASQPSGISKMMQAIGRRYVQYFNREHQRTGTLWEGRFRSCLIEAEDYLLECYRYIELNPVRAKMVTHPSEYFWSSYKHNACGLTSSILTPHPVYVRLAKNFQQRLSAYRSLFDIALDAERINTIKLATQKGKLIGSDSFKAEQEKLLDRRVDNLELGRPRHRKGF